MSLIVTLNGTNFTLPETGEVGWGSNTTSYLVAIAAGVLQKTGGSFLLSAEVDFGAAFGLQSLYYRSRSADVATSGILRLNNNSDAISWRNAANSANLPLLVNASNLLTFNGSTVYTIGAGTITNADIAPGAGIVYSKLNLSSSIINADINASAAIAFSKMAGLTANRLLRTGGSGITEVSEWSWSGQSLVTGNQQGLYFTDSTSNTVGIIAPSSVTTHLYQLPIAPGAIGQVLSWQSGGQLQWINAAGGGTVNSGNQYQLAYYAANGTALSGLALITGSRALASDANGLPVASATTATELGYVSGVTSAIQTQLNLKAPLASPTFTGTVTIPSPFTLGATSVTSSGTEMNYLVGVTSAIQTQLNGKEPTITVLPVAKGGTNSGTALSNNRVIQSSSGAIVEAAAITAARALISDGNGIPTHATVTSTELGYLSGVTSAIQTQLNAKADDSLVVHLAGTETITGTKTFSALVTASAGVSATTSNSGNIQDITASNTSNTASSRARVQAVVAGSSAGDAFFASVITGGSAWAWGGDNDSSDNWVLSGDNTPGTNNAIVVKASDFSVGLRGTTTTDSASSGFVGEYVETVVSTPTNFPTTAVYGDLGSISLSAGDWDVTFICNALNNSATWTQVLTGVSTNSGNDATGLVAGSNMGIGVWSSSSTTPEQITHTVASYRMSLSGTTTVYAKVRATYTTGTPQYRGRISARRVR